MEDLHERPLLPFLDYSSKARAQRKWESITDKLKKPFKKAQTTSSHLRPQSPKKGERPFTRRKRFIIRLQGLIPRRNGRRHH
jgi:hypothetical protein